MKKKQFGLYLVALFPACIMMSLVAYAIPKGGTGSANGEYVSGALTLSDTWDDMQVPGLSTRTGGSAPGFVSFLGGTYLYGFDDTTDEMVYFSVQLSHNYSEGSNLSPHVHWSPGTTGVGSVAWCLEYTIISPEGTFGAPGSAICANDTGDGTAYKQQLLGLPAILGTGLKVSSVLIGRLFRDANASEAGSSDTYTGDAFLVSFDLHYKIARLGTQNELMTP